MTSPTSSHLAAYTIGDKDKRPWGEYEVTAVGITESREEYCEKKITVLPKQILSLQSHELRREVWRVVSGQLTVILNDQKIILQPGQDIKVPLGSIHAMANLGIDPCVVFERQEGICREEDIKRYLDAYGRGVEKTTDPAVIASLAVYKQVLNAIQS